MKFVDNFEAWALEEYSEFENNMNDIVGRYHWHCYKNKTIILDMKTGKTGIAQCKKGDEFSPIIGVGIAWARLKDKEIPVERIEVIIKNLKIGDKFTFFSNSPKVYTFIYYYNVNSIKKCFYATGNNLTESYAADPDIKVLKI